MTAATAAAPSPSTVATGGETSPHCSTVMHTPRHTTASQRTLPDHSTLTKFMSRKLKSTVPTQTTRTGAGTAARARLRDDADMLDQQDSRSHIAWRACRTARHVSGTKYIHGTSTSSTYETILSSGRMPRPVTTSHYSRGQSAATASTRTAAAANSRQPTAEATSTMTRHPASDRDLSPRDTALPARVYTVCSVFTLRCRLSLLRRPPPRTAVTTAHPRTTDGGRANT
jgi:hypothetical protein